MFCLLHGLCHAVYNGSYCSSAGGVCVYACTAPVVQHLLLRVCWWVACSGMCWQLQLGLRPTNTYPGAHTLRFPVFQVPAYLAVGDQHCIFAYIIMPCSVMQLYLSLSAVLSACAVIFTNHSQASRGFNLNVYQLCSVWEHSTSRWTKHGGRQHHACLL
jgi:hypothetical protein